MNSLDSTAELSDAAGMGYFGGKASPGVTQTLINLMPEHRVYIEPFLGGAAVMRLKRPAEINIGLDRDPKAIAAASADTAFAAGAHRRATPQRTVGSSAHAPACFQFEVRDALEFLARYPFTGDEMVYCDPPYLLSTRASRRTRYAFDLSTDDHRRLLITLKRLPCHVMISGYWSKLYAAELEEWSAQKFRSTLRSGAQATEHIWFNYLAPARLHDYRFLGADYRERERIKRLRTSWLARIERLPLLERQALFAAIASTAQTAGTTHARQ